MRLQPMGRKVTTETASKEIDPNPFQKLNVSIDSVK